MRLIEPICLECNTKFVVAVAPGGSDVVAAYCPTCNSIVRVRVRPVDEIETLRAIAAAGYRILITFVDDQIVAHLSHKKYTNGTLLPEYVGSTFAAVLRQCYDAAMEAV